LLTLPELIVPPFHLEDPPSHVRSIMVSLLRSRPYPFFFFLFDVSLSFCVFLSFRDPFKCTPVSLPLYFSLPPRARRNSPRYNGPVPKLGDYCDFKSLRIFEHWLFYPAPTLFSHSFPKSTCFFPFPFRQHLPWRLRFLFPPARSSASVSLKWF